MSLTRIKPSLKAIHAIVFDFDGVLAESIDVKTRAYALLFRDEGEEVVRKVIDFHLKNGGVSRFEKIKFFYKDILHRPLSDKLFQKLCDQYSRLVVDKVVVAPWVDGARDFLTHNKKKFILAIVSGTPEDELKNIIQRRGMNHFFNSVKGSPKSKVTLLSEVMDEHKLKPKNVVFIGDAKTDWLAARETGVHFLWRCVSTETPTPFGYVGPRLSSLRKLETDIENLALHYS